MVEETVKMWIAVSRKRKQVPVDEPQVIGDVLDLVEASVKKIGKCTIGRGRKCAQQKLSLQNIDLEQKGSVELKDQDIKDYIIVILYK